MQVQCSIKKIYKRVILLANKKMTTVKSLIYIEQKADMCNINYDSNIKPHRCQIFVMYPRDIKCSGLLFSYSGK